MSYRVSYAGDHTKKVKTTARIGKPQRWLLGGILLLIGAAALSYTGAAQQILRWLLPGDPETTAQALHLLTEQLAQGENLKEAISAFCRKILEGTQLV